MEKVYMEAPKKKNDRMWRPTDVSPYDFKEEHAVNGQPTEFNEEEFDMDAILKDMSMLDDEMNHEILEPDMYENRNIDYRYGEDVSQRPYSSQTMDRKMIVEEDNPKRKTTTWMRVTRHYQ